MTDLKWFLFCISSVIFTICGIAVIIASYKNAAYRYSCYYYECSPEWYYSDYHNQWIAGIVITAIGGVMILCSSFMIISRLTGFIHRIPRVRLSLEWSQQAPLPQTDDRI